jgi:hypothetical protein
LEDEALPVVTFGSLWPGASSFADAANAGAATITINAAIRAATATIESMRLKAPLGTLIVSCCPNIASSLGVGERGRDFAALRFTLHKDSGTNRDKAPRTKVQYLT